MAKALLLAIDTLRFTTKKRRGVCARRVEELRRMLESDGDLMPIRVNALHDGTFVVKDGRHRIRAHIEAGIYYIYAVVENYTKRFRRFFLILIRAAMRLFFLYFGVLIPH